MQILAFKFDIVVVGAGPAGLYAAIYLKQVRPELSVLVLESKKKIKPKLCGDYLCPPSINLLLERDLRQILRESKPIKGMQLFAADGTTVNCPFSKTNKIQGISIRRQRFDTLLCEKALELGVEVSFGEAATEIAQSGSSWHVCTQKRYIDCKLLIGADGRSSYVAKKLQWRVEKFGERIALRTYAERRVLPAEMPILGNGEFGEMHILPDSSYIGVNPISTNLVSLCLVTDRKKLNGHKLSQVFEKAFWSSGALPKKYRLNFKEHTIDSAYPIKNDTKKIAEKNVALIGDAAGFIDPITGEGNYAALKSASLLVKELTAIDLRSNLELSIALTKYTLQYQREFAAKAVLNYFFQFLIRRASLANTFAKCLRTFPRFALKFMQIAANCNRTVDNAEFEAVLQNCLHGDYAQDKAA